MVGWALASAWSQKRYLRLGATYAFAVIIHGLWNGMAVLSSIGSMEGQVDISIPTALQQIGTFSSIGVIVLLVFNLILYISFNAVLRNSNSSNTSLSTGEGEPANLTMGGPTPTWQIESISPSTESSSLVNNSEPLLQPRDEQLLTPLDKPPVRPESNL
jgi:hypothetical protein